MSVVLTTKVYAYLFNKQSLVVNDQLDFPYLDPHPDDLIIHQTEQQVFVAREIADDDQLPHGFSSVPIRQLIAFWDNEQFYRVSRALQLLEWQRNHRFCSRCGHATIPHSTENAMLCPACHYSQYPRVQPCVIMAITRGKQILLARSAQRHTAMFGLLAGFVEVGETLEHAVARETLEETALSVKNIQYMSSQPWPFPSNLMIGFKAEYDSGDIYPQAGEIAEAAFFDFDNLPQIPPKGSIAYWMIEQIIQQNN
jgi:NAD+ diphosphatase